MDSKCVCDTRLAIKCRKHATKFMRNFNETHTESNVLYEYTLKYIHTYTYTYMHSYILGWPMNASRCMTPPQNGDSKRLPRTRNGMKCTKQVSHVASRRGPCHKGTSRRPAWLPGAINAASACYQTCGLLAPGSVSGSGSAFGSFFGFGCDSLTPTSTRKGTGYRVAEVDSRGGGRSNSAKSGRICNGGQCGKQPQRSLAKQRRRLKRGS